MTSNDSADTVAGDIGGKAIAAVVGGTVGGVPGALVAVALEPVFIHLAAKSWEELSELRRRSAGYMLQTASEQLGGAPEEVVTRSLGATGTAHLLADALQAAAATSNTQKIRALGRALANGLAADEARVDEERLVIAGLSGLEESHVRVLANLPRQRSRPVSKPGSSATGAAGRRGITLATVAAASGLSVEGATNVLSELVRTGMASRDTYAAERRHDRYILDLQTELAKLQWILENPGKKVQSNRRPKTLKKPGSIVEPGYERTPFGDRCLEYLDSMPSEDLIDVPQDEGADADDEGI
jgi:hypothetical protein